MDMLLEGLREKAVERQRLGAEPPDTTIDATVFLFFRRALKNVRLGIEEIEEHLELGDGEGGSRSALRLAQGDLARLMDKEKIILTAMSQALSGHALEAWHSILDVWGPKALNVDVRRDEDDSGNSEDDSEDWAAAEEILRAQALADEARREIQDDDA